MSKIVTLRYDPLWRPFDWAKQHCKSYITNVAHTSNETRSEYAINYHFGNEKDATLFKIAWSQELA